MNYISKKMSKGWILSIIMVILVLSLSGLVGCNTDKKTISTSKGNVITSTPKPTLVAKVNEDSSINEYHPIIKIINIGDNKRIATLLGGSKDGKWFKSSDLPYIYKGKDIRNDETQLFEAGNNGSSVTTKLMSGNEEYKLYSNNAYIETLKSGVPNYHYAAASGDVDFGFDFNSSNKLNKLNEDTIIGINGSWDATLRKLQKLDDKNAYTVDLDNDSKIETISIKESTKNIKNVVSELVKYKDISAQIEIGKNKNISITSLLGNYIAIDKLDIMALDVNGDGKLELVINYHGVAESGPGYGGIVIFEFKNSKLTKVLEHGYNDYE